MAYDEALRSVSLNADSSLAVYTGVPDQAGSASPNSGNQYRFIKVTGVGLVGLCTAATDLVVGISQNKPQHTGDPTTVGFSGISRITVGVGGLTAGDLVAPDATGRGVTDNTHGKWIALQTSATVGSLIAVMRIL